MHAETAHRTGTLSTVARAVLGFIALIAFLDTFALVPVLAPYAKRALNATDLEAGLILSLYSLATLGVGFFSGVLIDRWGRRVPMALSLWCAGVLIALYAWVSTAEAMMLVRALHGATSAVFVPALFTMVGEYGQQNRTRAMGSIGALVGLVAIFAPPLSGMVVKRFGEPTLFLAVAILMVLAGLSALILRDPHTKPQPEARISPRLVLRLPLPMASYLLTLGMTFAMGLLVFALPVRLEMAGYDSAYRGQLLGLFALVAVVVMAGVRRQAALGGAFNRAVLGVLLLGIGAFALGTLPVPTGTWGAVLLYGLGFGLTYPAVHIIAFEGAPEHMRGTALAGLYVFYALGYVLGPAVGGAVLGYGIAGLVGAGVCGSAAAMSLWLRRNAPNL